MCIRLAEPTLMLIVSSPVHLIKIFLRLPFSLWCKARLDCSAPAVVTWSNLSPRLRFFHSTSRAVHCEGHFLLFKHCVEKWLNYWCLLCIFSAALSLLFCVCVWSGCRFAYYFWTGMQFSLFLWKEPCMSLHFKHSKCQLFSHYTRCLSHSICKHTWKGRVEQPNLWDAVL